MRVLEVFVLAVTIATASSSPILEWGKQDGNSLLGKVSNIKHTVYEKKREFINGINEKVSKILWIPPWPSTTTEGTVAVVPPQQDPVSESPNLWWWQATAKPNEPTTVSVALTSTTESAPATARDELDNDRLVFTVADTNELEIPIVSMYARSGFIPPELRLTDSVEYVGPVFGSAHGTGPVPAKRQDRLIVL